jgi:hypothetical protein
MNQTYRHSGKFTPVGLAAGVITGLAGGSILAYIYAWGIIKIDEQKAAALATLTYGAAVGLAAAYGMKLGKVRNSKVGSVVAGVLAAISLYASWAFWAENILVRFQQADLNPYALMRHPQALWELIKTINQYGTWGLSEGEVTKGAFLWAIWALEAAAILYAAGLAAYLLLQMQPFCEKCQLWCSSNEELCLSAGDPAYIRRSLARRDLTFLEKLGPGNQRNSYLTAQLHSCSNCGDVNTLTLTQTASIRGQKWYQRSSVQKTELVKKFLLSRLEADAFRNTAHNVKQIAKAAKA